MVSNFLSVAALALAASRMASAQTFTLCNPTKTTCPADPAFGGSVTIDFTKGANAEFTVADGTTMKYDPSNGAAFTINKGSDAPTITSKKYLFYGKVEAVIQAAPGQGIVSSFVLQSDDLDEIDWEWLGGDNTQVQTNYYSKGDTTTYDRGGFSGVASPNSQFHTYTIDWKPDSLTWLIDGSAVRVLNYADAKGGSTYPQTPMQIKLGTWDGGAPGEPEGTVNWAGGLTNFANAPFVAYVKSVTVTDYSNGKSGASQYVYGDKSGSSGSIQIVTGGSGSNGEVSASGTMTGTATGTATNSKSTVTSATTTSANKTSTSTTLSTSTVANTTSASTTVTSPKSTAAASTTAAGSASATPTGASAAGRISTSMAHGAFVVAAFFAYFML
jgi:beta-glucanase (GH16 family)